MIPAFNEERRIERTLSALTDHLDLTGDRCWEILVCDDGSSDRTRSIVTRRAADDDRVRYLPSPTNIGKGAALRRGFGAARGTWVLFLDADLPVPVETIADLRAAAAAARADVVAGSRRLPGSVITTGQPRLRRVGGRTFRLCAETLGFGGNSDPQCGVKLLRRGTVASVIDAAELSRFGFDIELLTRCRAQHLVVVEHPVTWTHIEGSTLRPVRDALATIRELLRLRRLLRNSPRPARAVTIDRSVALPDERDPIDVRSDGSLTRTGPPPKL